MNDFMSGAGKIINIDPPYGIPGGEIVIDCADFDSSSPSQCSVLFGDTEGQIVALGPRRVLAQVPETKGGEVDVRLKSKGDLSEPARLTIAKKLAGDLHPVANPAFDPDDGALFVTRSGSRGEELPVTLFKIDLSGDVSEYSGDIPNPTGIAFGPDGQMFVSSRLEGVVYRLTPFKEAAVFARNLGIATGIAFDRRGVMYVGDRTGTVFKVNGIGEERPWAQIEPSVSAFHLAFGPDESLYVTGPTVTSFDSIWRINPEGEVDVFFKGLGRPQGLAFDREGNLYVAAALRGRRGIVRITPNGEAKLIVAGINLVGLAFSAAGEMAVVSIDSVYSVATQIKGTLLRS
ncbi:MAG TPA: IPT/TIG domain-containing protein [Pyrinomonadaceae bacterium]|nr:IPT/TIG domain-containing protein [Pyrinomonadaceae bacterium]